MIQGVLNKLDPNFHLDSFLNKLLKPKRSIHNFPQTGIVTMSNQLRWFDGNLTSGVFRASAPCNQHPKNETSDISSDQNERLPTLYAWIQHSMRDHATWDTIWCDLRTLSCVDKWHSNLYLDLR